MMRTAHAVFLRWADTAAHNASFPSGQISGVSLPAQDRFVHLEKTIVTDHDVRYNAGERSPDRTITIGAPVDNRLQYRFFIGP